MSSAVTFFAGPVRMIMVIGVGRQTDDVLPRRGGRIAFGHPERVRVDRPGGRNAAYQEDHQHQLAQKAHVTWCSAKKAIRDITTIARRVKGAG